MEIYKKSIIKTLTANPGILYLAYAKENGFWVWVGYVGQGQYDFSPINEAEMVSSIKDMVDSGDLIPMDGKPASIQGISLAFYKLTPSC